MTLEIENVVGLFVRDKQSNTILKVLHHGEVIVGRAVGSGITLNHASVSKRHARIYTYLMVSYIEDLGSTNGTYINDKRVDKHVIHPGDIIRCGEYELLLDVRKPEFDSKPEFLMKSGA
jgi:pSer/pThr/pTyr-binding forkhead associated (FHA) protein